MRVVETAFKDVVIIEPDVHCDLRGCFQEVYNRKRYEACGIDCEFVQDNLTVSKNGTLRGLHFQVSKPQAKMVQVLSGEIYDVVLDVRSGSPDFGCWISTVLSEENKRQLFVPEGFAHGFCVTGESAVVFYKCSNFYSPEDEQGVLWSDPLLGIPWPVDTPVLSEKDRNHQTLSEISEARLLKYKHHR